MNVSSFKPNHKTDIHKNLYNTLTIETVQKFTNKLMINLLKGITIPPLKLSLHLSFWTKW